MLTSLLVLRIVMTPSHCALFSQRNYRTFLLFIFTTSVLCIYVFACCLTQLFLKHNELVDDARTSGKPVGGLWGKTLADVPAALALMAYTFLFFLFVGGLTGFHSYLVATNQTTYENFRYNNSDMPNPYDIGLFSNCAQVGHLLTSEWYQSGTHCPGL